MSATVSLTLSGLGRIYGAGPPRGARPRAAADDAGVDQIVLPDHVVMGRRTDRYPFGTFPYPPEEPLARAARRARRDGRRDDPGASQHGNPDRAAAAGGAAGEDRGHARRALGRAPRPRRRVGLAARGVLGERRRVGRSRAAPRRHGGRLSRPLAGRARVVRLADGVVHGRVVPAGAVAGPGHTRVVRGRRDASARRAASRRLGDGWLPMAGTPVDELASGIALVARGVRASRPRPRRGRRARGAGRRQGRPTAGPTSSARSTRQPSSSTWASPGVSIALGRFVRAADDVAAFFDRARRARQPAAERRQPTPRHDLTCDRHQLVGVRRVDGHREQRDARVVVEGGSERRRGGRRPRASRPSSAHSSNGKPTPSDGGQLEHARVISSIGRGRHRDGRRARRVARRARQPRRSRARPWRARRCCARRSWGTSAPPTGRRGRGRRRSRRREAATARRSTTARAGESGTWADGDSRWTTAASCG